MALHDARPERLSDQQDVTLVLKVLVTRRGELVRGEVGGLAADQHTERWVRFRGAAGLLGAVQVWLAGELDDLWPRPGTPTPPTNNERDEA
jgi:hypothetical protein